MQIRFSICLAAARYSLIRMVLAVDALLLLSMAMMITNIMVVIIMMIVMMMIMIIAAHRIC